MTGQTKWKNALLAALALGAIGISTYGVYHTSCAYDSLQNGPNTAVETSSSQKGTTGGTLCSLYGCTGCSGCANGSSIKNIEIMPDSATEIARIN
jgi:hypothetical protein